MGSVFNAMGQLIYLQETNTVSIVQAAGWFPGQIWIVAENFALTGIRSPYHPACSESLQRNKNTCRIFIFVNHMNIIQNQYMPLSCKRLPRSILIYQLCVYLNVCNMSSQMKHVTLSRITYLGIPVFMCYLFLE